MPDILLTLIVVGVVLWLIMRDRAIAIIVIVLFAVWALRTLWPHLRL